MIKPKNKWLPNGGIVVVLLLVEISKSSVLLVKKNYGYQEINDLKREEFVFKLNQIDKKDIVYVDEAGIDNREDYPYAYGVKGKRVPGMKSGKRTERVSWVAAVNQSKMFAPLTFTGSCNRDLFENWLENCLLPRIKTRTSYHIG